MTETELPITGYLDRFSHRPGETFTAHVSVRDGGAYRARLVRVLSGDPNPSGPGMRFEDQSHRFDQSFTGRRQPIHHGSYGIVDAGPARDAGSACTWTVLVRPGVVDAGQVLLARGSRRHRRRAADRCERRDRADHVGRRHDRARDWNSDAGGALVSRMAGGGPRKRTCAGRPAPTGRRAGDARKWWRPGSLCRRAARCCSRPSDATAPNRHFTGKLEDPAILRGFVTFWPEIGTPLESFADDLLAGWDFSRGIDTQAIHDIGPHACHGRLVNMPTRAMVGTRWSGREQCWRHAPEDYGAIHFHADDLGDCNWQADFTWTVPDDLRSGAYALHLTCDSGEDWLPLYVLPQRRGPFAPIAFLASTFTYQAYANHARTSIDAGVLRPRRGVGRLSIQSQ